MWRHDVWPAQGGETWCHRAENRWTTSGLDTQPTNGGADRYRRTVRVLDSTNGILKDLTEKGGASFLVETNAMLNGTGQPQPCVFLSGPGVTDKCLTFPPERFCTTAKRNESWHARNQPHLKWLLVSPSWSKRFDWLKVPEAAKRRTDQKMLFTHRQFVVRFSSAVNRRRCQFSPGICPHFSFVYFAIVIDLSSCFLDGTSGTIVPCLDPDQKFTQKWKKKQQQRKK